MRPIAIKVLFGRLKPTLRQIDIFERPVKVRDWTNVTPFYFVDHYSNRRIFNNKNSILESLFYILRRLEVRGQKFKQKCYKSKKEPIKCIWLNLTAALSCIFLFACFARYGVVTYWSQSYCSKWIYHFMSASFAILDI